MLRKSILFILLLIGGFFLLPSAVSADTYSVSITATQFIPSTLSVEEGDTIRFINTTSATQSAKTTDADGFNTGNIGPGENKSVVVSNAGSYTYSSQYTPSLTGTVVVAAAAGTSPTSTSSASTTTTTGTTSQPAQTQAQPVSGTFEVFVALVTAGVGFILLGMVSKRFQPVFTASNDSTVELPSISVRIKQTEGSDDSSELV